MMKNDDGDEGTTDKKSEGKDDNDSHFCQDNNNRQKDFTSTMPAHRSYGWTDDEADDEEEDMEAKTIGSCSCSFYRHR